MEILTIVSMVYKKNIGFVFQNNPSHTTFYINNGYDNISSSASYSGGNGM